MSVEPATPRARPWREAILPAAILLAGALAPLPDSQNRAIANLPAFCPFRAVLSIPCPGCGLTRAFVCGCHGQIARSFLLHPAALILVAMLLIGVVRPALGGRRTVDFQRLDTLSWPFIVAFAGLLICCWLFRLAGLIPSVP